jgi:uncharacterized protein YxjI
MKLYIEPGKFTWGSPLALQDRAGHTRYTLIGDAYSVGKRLHLRDLSGREAVSVRQRVPSLRQQYELEVYGRPVGTISKDMSTLRPRYALEELGWEVGGVPSLGNFEILWQGSVVAACRPEPQGEVFLLELYDRTVELAALGLMLVVGCILVPQESR